MSDKHFVGLDVMGFENNGQALPISRVTLLVDDENVVTAGDNTGRELAADCPHATQEMVDAILAAVQGFRYQMYSADAANIDPAAELGDGVDVGGVYSVIAQIDDDGSGYISLSAPGEEELEDEYPVSGPVTQAFDRKIAETRSRITKTAEEIRLEIENEVKGLSASIDLQLDHITSQVTGLDGQVSTLKQTAASLQSQISSVSGDVTSLEQTVNSISLSVSNGTASSTIALLVDGVEVASKTIRFTGDVVFESDLSDGTTLISGECVRTGQIEADYLKLGGPMEVYRTTTSSRLGGYIGYVTSYDYNGSKTTGMGMMNEDEDCQVVVTTAGARLTSPTAEVVAAVNITLQTSRAVNVEASSFNSDVDLSVSSDRRLKDEIQYDLTEKYLSVFDRLRPASFLYKGKGTKRHLGFIAQDVESALFDAGLSYDDFAALNVDNPEQYGLIYGEFIAVLTAKIQQLEARLKCLEV